MPTMNSPLGQLYSELLRAANGAHFQPQGMRCSVERVNTRHL